jgi:hypothetical protein
VTSLVRVPFHGDELLAVQDDSGVWVSVRRVCENLGLQRQRQQEKLAAKAWARTSLMKGPVAADGKNREQMMVHLDSLPMWLATIDAGRVAHDVRPKVERYQLEAARVLAEHFVQQRRADERQRFYDRLLLKEPLKRDGQWPTTTWQAIQRLYRWPIEDHPWPGFRRIVGLIHRRYLGDDGRDEVRRRNPNPESERDYAFFGDDLHTELKDRECLIIEAFANGARGTHLDRGRDIGLFWEMLDRHTNYQPAPGELSHADPRQLLLFDRLIAGEADASTEAAE